MKKHVTIYEDDEDNNVFDQEFLEQEFEYQLMDWRENEQSSDYFTSN